VQPNAGRSTSRRKRNVTAGMTDDGVLSGVRRPGGSACDTRRDRCWKRSARRMPVSGNRSLRRIGQVEQDGALGDNCWMDVLRLELAQNDVGAGTHRRGTSTLLACARTGI
jgi:hypothetical protein